MGPMADDRSVLKSGLPEPATPTTPTPGTHRASERATNDVTEGLARHHAPDKDKGESGEESAVHEKLHRRPTLRAKGEIPEVVNAP